MFALGNRVYFPFKSY